MLDDSGNVVPNCDDLITFEVIGGRIVGIGNGDPNSHHIETDSKINLFHGKAQVVCVGQELIVHCKGFADCRLKLN